MPPLDWAELVSMPTCMGVFVTLICTLATLGIQLSHWRMAKGLLRVSGSVVDYARSWDESYQRELHVPVVEVVLPTGPTRVTVEAGVTLVNGRTTHALGDVLTVYVDPKAPDEGARVLMSWWLVLGIGPFAGVCAFAILFVTQLVMALGR